MKSLNKRALIISLLVALTLSVCIQVGYAADTAGELMVGNVRWWLSGVSSYVALLTLSYVYLTRWHDGVYKRIDGMDKGNPGNIFWYWIIIFVCWIPVFLAEYPGFFVYDATDEYVEVATRSFTTHHPLLHVMMLGGSVCAGNKFLGDINAGIACYIVFQMLLVSFLFAWIISKLSTRVGRISALLWYGLFPTIVMFVLCSAKDTLFAAFLSAAVVLIIRVIKKQGGELLLVFSLIGMMLMRHNGVYALAVYMIAAIIYGLMFNVKGVENKVGLLTRFKLALICLVALIGYKACDYSLVKITNAIDYENQEILTVPIQQLARTWSVYKDEMTPTQLNTLYEILPENVLKHYTPSLSDPVKADFNNEMYAANPGKYRSLWWELFKEHPLSYINAWINTSYGYYYPGVVVNVYEGHEVYTFTYDESSYFGYEVEYPGERHSLIPVLDDFYRWLSLDDDIQRIPIISIPFSMGAIFILYVVCLAILIYQGDKNDAKEGRYAGVIALLLPALVWLTLLLGPTFLPRYTVFMWFLVPYVIHITFLREKIEDVEDIDEKDYNTCAGN